MRQVGGAVDGARRAEPVTDGMLRMMAHSELEKRLKMSCHDELVRRILHHHGWPIVDYEVTTQVDVGALDALETEEDDVFAEEEEEVVAATLSRFEPRAVAALECWRAARSR